MRTADPLEAIQAAAAVIAVSPFSEIHPDGRLRRIHDPLYDRPGECTTWLVAFLNPDGTIGGKLGNWKKQVSISFCTSILKTYTPEEKARFAREQAEARAKAEAERTRRTAEAAAKSVQVWRRSRAASPAHVYLAAKGVRPHRARQVGAALVFDYRDVDGNLTTLQFIQPDGSKRFLSGGAVGGSSHRFGGKLHDVLLLAEGFATGATLHEASGYPVAVCGFAGNLLPVALAVRAKYPGARIVVAGDADPVGERAAREAAEAVDGVVCLPDFSQGGGWGGYGC